MCDMHKNIVQKCYIFTLTEIKNLHNCAAFIKIATLLDLSFDRDYNSVMSKKITVL